MNRTRIAQILAFVLFSGAVGGCNLNDLTNLSDSIEGGSVNIKVIESPEGARWVYLGGIDQFAQLFAANAVAVGRFTDEISLTPTGTQRPIDIRIDQDGLSTGGVTVADLYSFAQSAKVQLEQALQLLREYSGTAGYTMQAHALGMLGMIHLIIADNFCSGIPLSESKWGGKFNPGKGYPADSLYQRAIELFDAGIALNSDSAEVKVLLLVGKARALNALGRWSEAATVASQVATTDSIWIRFKPRNNTTASQNFPEFGGGQLYLDTTNYIVVNGKGTNGLIWIVPEPQQQDERIAIRTVGQTYVTPWKPRFLFENRTIPIATGAEARLIEAEFHLREGEPGVFLEKINAARRLYKTYGGTPISDTTDPGNDESRVDLLFRERAYTFYVSGRRLGDFRRLVRQYGRAPLTVYPTGAAAGSSFVIYGDNYVFAPELPGSGSESQYNQFYFQCDDYAP